MKPPYHMQVMWPDGSVVGHLVNRGTIFFVYDEAWVKFGRNLSPVSLPFKAVGFDGAKGIDGLPGLIADCLPDAWGKKVARSEFERLKLAPPSALDLLAWRGARGIGALQFKPAIPPHGQAASSRMEEITLASLARGALEIERGVPSTVLPQLARGGTAGGAYPKALVLVYPDGLMGVGEPDGLADACLVKFDMPNRGGLTQCEHAYASMASAAGIRSVDTKLVPEGNKRHLLVTRFDIADMKAPKHRLHFHSMSGMLHKEPGSLDYRDGFRALLTLGMPFTEMAEWARRMLFNVLSSNADDHGKNHGFLYDEKNRSWALSPAYDMLFSESMLARGMPIVGEVWPSIDTMRELSEKAGLKRQEFDQAVDQVSAAVADWPKIAKVCEVPPALIRSVSDQMDRIRQSVFPAKGS